jgi:hypothetical protein
MTTLLSLAALYIFIVVGVGELLAGQGWPGATLWLPATASLKSVNWNGDDDKKSGGK